jgi:hypothetical protein
VGWRESGEDPRWEALCLSAAARRRAAAAAEEEARTGSLGADDGRPQSPVGGHSREADDVQVPVISMLRLEIWGYPSGRSVWLTQICMT